MYLQEALYLIQEEAAKRRSVRTSVIRMNKNRKRNLYAGKAAVNIAKKKNHSLYARYERKKRAFVLEKKKMQRMYKAQARRLARKTIR